MQDFALKIKKMVSRDYVPSSALPRSVVSRMGAIGILQPCKVHFLSPEGARMQDFALKIKKIFSRDYALSSALPRSVVSRMGAIK